MRSSVDFPQPDGPDEDEELTAVDRQRDVVDGHHAAGEDLADLSRTISATSDDHGVYTALSDRKQWH
jgi:hypothetical protein